MENILLRQSNENVQQLQRIVTDAELVRTMIDEYRSVGLAVIGVHDVVAALANGQVDTVFLGEGLEQLHSSKEKGMHEALAPALKELPEGAGM